MKAADVLRSAVFSLRGNFLRSILTALGVIIGIAAVIVMVSVGQGTQTELDNMISKLGSNRLEVFSSSSRQGPVRGGAGSGTGAAVAPIRPSRALRCGRTGCRRC